jgi:hypothetical protein
MVVILMFTVNTTPTAGKHLQMVQFWDVLKQDLMLQVITHTELLIKQEMLLNTVVILMYCKSYKSISCKHKVVQQIHHIGI